MINYKETTPTKILNGGTWESTLNYVCTHRPVRMVCSNRPNIMLVLANDYEEMVLKVPKWISVDDEKPSDKTGYNVLVKTNGIVGEWICILSWNGKIWTHKGGQEYPAIVTHWMPLPSKDL